MSIYINDKSGATPQQTLIAGISSIDQILNGNSKNAIANKAVYNALQEKIEKTVNDLIYYYDKNDVYNKAEVRQLIGAINTLTIEVVAQLPTTDISTTTIYFVGPATGTNTYDEYVYVNNTWVKIGDTDIDLSQYLEIDDFEIAIADYYTKAEIDLLLQNVEIDVDDEFDDESENPVQNKVVKTAIDAKQDKVFVGTVAEWEALSLSEKNKYDLVNITDDGETGETVDAVTDGDMRAVSSNAVANQNYLNIIQSNTLTTSYGVGYQANRIAKVGDHLYSINGSFSSNSHMSGVLATFDRTAYPINSVVIPCALYDTGALGWTTGVLYVTTNNEYPGKYVLQLIGTNGATNIQRVCFSALIYA